MVVVALECGVEVVDELGEASGRGSYIGYGRGLRLPGSQKIKTRFAGWENHFEMASPK